MSLTKTSSPDLLAPVGSRSYWVTSGNPIIFKYQRKDAGVISIQDFFFSTRVNIASVPSDVQVGQYAYISNFGYTGTYLITSIGVGYVVLDETFAGNQTGGFINFVGARNNYHMDVVVYRATPTGNNLLGSFKFYDNAVGIVTLDFSGIVDAELDLDEVDYNYTPVNGPDTGRSLPFMFQYREMYRGSPGVAYSSLSDSYFAVKAIKQPGDDYGQNMRDYMLDTATDPIQEDYIAKFLTKFERPMYFVGYPFTLSFLYTENVAAYYLIRKEQEKDLNGVNVGAETSATLDFNSRTVINRLNNRKGYSDNIHAFELWLEQGAAIDFSGSGYGTGTGGGGASTDYFAEDYDENWGT